MMRAALSVLTVGTLCCVALADVFFITAPDVIHFSRDETVSVNVLGGNAATSVTVYIQDYPARSRRISETTVQVPPNAPQLVDVKIEPSDLDWPDVETAQPVNQYVYLVAEAAAAGFKKEALVRVSTNSHYVFIQTDKPIYTPRQKIYYRVFTMDNNMRPDSVPVTLDVMNTQGVVIDRQQNQRSEDGIINAHFTFPDIVMEGNWSLVALYGHKNRRNVTAKFEVREYVLPTFSVKINPPKFILPADTRIIGFVEAKHTYGEPVAGRAEVKLEVVQGDDRRHFLTVSKMLDMNGVYSFNPELSALTGLGANYQFPNLEGALLHVEATVTEVYTGKSQTSITRSTVFASSPYKIKFPRTSRYFKPALPYVLRMDTVFSNGKTAGNVVLQVSATAVTGAGNVQVAGFGGDNEINEVTSDEGGGRAQFTLDIPRDAQSLTINVRTVDQTLSADQQGRAELTITAFSSPSNSYLLVRSSAQVVRVTDNLEAEVFITSIGDVNFLNYMVIGRGKILYQRTEVRQAGIVTTLHIPVTPNMSPSIRLLVYYVRGNNEVVADSVWVDVVDECQNPVSLELDENVYKPGQNTRLKVSGTPGSKVALLAVDQAVYILNDKNTLTQDIMFKRMEDFDLGCTPGGGQNSQGVFQDIGLTTINNAGLNIPQRAQEGCPEPENRRKRSVDTPLLSNVPQCCQQGMAPLQSTPLTVRNCQIRAANLQDASSDCIKAYFRCCRRAATRSQGAESDDDRTRADGNVELVLNEFDLIVEKEDEIPVRSKFPESWLFLTKEIGDQGHISQTITFPDSITSWSLQAVGVSSSTGMCVATPTNVTVFRNYFIHLDMPYSAVHDEQIEIRATLYNYRDAPLVAVVYLMGDEGICYGARAGQNTEQIRLTVQPNSAKQVAWPIVPLETGDFPIRVKAFTIDGGDIVEKILHVVPKGLQKRQTKTIVLDPSGDLQLRSGGTPPPGVRNGEQFVSVPLVMPAETVPGSAHCSVSVTGKIMGPVVQAVLATNTLEPLIRCPHGCGEQTLSILGPLVYVAKYLRQTDQMTGQKEQQLYDLIQRGVTREMTFRKFPGGGFSKWPDRLEASTWLTAFAAKVFSHAREFNAFETDPSDVICKAVHWMIQQQNPSGAYRENERVRIRTMTGGVQGDITLTAYVLVGALEANCQSHAVEASLNRAVNFLESQVPNIVRPYQAAITAYALALAQSNRRNEANNRLRDMAVFDQAQNIRHWPASTQALGAQKPYWYRRNPSAIEVETAGYAILAQIANGDITYANPVVNWLVAQRKENGGFISTQDSVIGLQALSYYSINTTHSDLLDLECTLRSEKDGRFREEIVVNEENADVKQAVEVTKYLGGELFIDIRGEGVGQAQVELVYNVHDVAADRCRFDLTIHTEEFVPGAQEEGVDNNDVDDFDPDNPLAEDLPDVDWPNMPVEDRGVVGAMDRNAFAQQRRVRGRNRNNDNNQNDRARVGGNDLSIRISSCVRYLGEMNTGMAILDVGLFTGFAPIVDDLKALKRNASLGIGRYELNDRSVVFYLDTVPTDQSVCIGFTAKRNFQVGMTHAVAVSVYDYYEPDEKCVKFYHPEFQSPLLHKMCANDQCVCAEAKCGSCYSFEPFDEQPWSFAKMMLKACSRGMDYVLRITVEDVQFDIAFEIATVRIEKVIKKGAENVQEQQTLTFWKKSGCTCPFLDVGITYYVMGRDGMLVENEAGQKRYKYLLDEQSYVIEHMERQQYQRDSIEWLQARDQHKFQRDLSKRGCGT